jgi:hypothetical protein
MCNSGPPWARVLILAVPLPVSIAALLDVLDLVIQHSSTLLVDALQQDM